MSEQREMAEAEDEEEKEKEGVGGERSKGEDFTSWTQHLSAMSLQASFLINLTRDISLSFPFVRSIPLPFFIIYHKPMGMPMPHISS